MASHLMIIYVSKVKALLGTHEPLVSNCQICCPVLKVDIIFVVPDETVGFAVTAYSGKARERLREMRVEEGTKNVV